MGKVALICVGILCGTIGLVYWAYRHDLEQLSQFYSERADTEMRLRAYQICLDMEEHPEDWKNKSLKLPCDLDPEALRSIIPDFETSVED